VVVVVVMAVMVTVGGSPAITTATAALVFRAGHIQRPKINQDPIGEDYGEQDRTAMSNGAWCGAWYARACDGWRAVVDIPT